ncbi:MAG: CHAT domain-containing protein, partial [Caldilineaceae bacterium]
DTPAMSHSLPSSTAPAHLDFDLFIEKNEDGLYSRVMDSPVGTATAIFHMPMSEHEIEAFARTASSPFRPDSFQFETARKTARDLGSRLFDAVFTAEVGAMLHRCMDIAYQQSTRLRIRLMLSKAPELMRLPWETMFNPNRGEYMALSAHAPLSRYVERMHAVRPFPVKPPMRLLVVVAGPPGYSPVETEREWISLIDTLDVLGARGDLIVERLPRPSLFELQKRLRKQDYQLLHFAGHALYSTQAEESCLVVEDEQGRARQVSGAHLGAILRDHYSLRLVTLNSCAPWQPLPREPFTHIAYSLVHAGLPAAIALPYELTDRAALAFHYELYSRLVTGEAVDLAVAEARRSMLADAVGVEWCAPVLVNRVRDGLLFEPALETPLARGRAASVAELYPTYRRARPDGRA